MEVFFEPTKGKPFSMGVQYIDTVRNVKEMIQELKNIAVSKQTLIFKNQILRDHIDFSSYDIIEYPHIHLLITLTADDHPELIPVSSVPSFWKITLPMRMPLSKIWVSIEIDITQTVRKLKEIIQELEGIPVSRILLHYQEKDEMDDRKSLQDYQLFHFSEILSLLRPSTSSSTIMSPPPPPEKLVVWLLTYADAKKIPVVVKMAENVAVLQKELETIKVESLEKIYLPEDRYMFVYQEQVMEEDQSFLSQSVKHDATIKVVSKLYRSPRPPRPPRKAQPPPPPRVLAKREKEKMIIRLRLRPPQPGVPLPVPEMLTVWLLTYPDAEKIPVIVNASDHVVMLRMELERFKVEKPEDIYVPEDGYVFVYKEQVMEENQSFVQQSVKHGSTIIVVPEAPPPGPSSVLGKREREKIIRLPLGSLPPLIRVPQPVPPQMQVVEEDSPEKLTVHLLTYPDAEKIPVTVNAADDVVVLRIELARIKEEKPNEVYLPEEGYTFSYGGEAMEEDQSFLWQSVEDGATIDVVPYDFGF